MTRMKTLILSLSAVAVVALPCRVPLKLWPRCSSRGRWCHRHCRKGPSLTALSFLEPPLGNFQITIFGTNEVNGRPQRHQRLGHHRDADDRWHTHVGTVYEQPGLLAAGRPARQRDERRGWHLHHGHRRGPVPGFCVCYQRPRQHRRLHEWPADRDSAVRQRNDLRHG